MMCYLQSLEMLINVIYPTIDSQNPSALFLVSFLTLSFCFIHKTFFFQSPCNIISQKVLIHPLIKFFTKLLKSLFGYLAVLKSICVLFFFFLILFYIINHCSGAMWGFCRGWEWRKLSSISDHSAPSFQRRETCLYMYTCIPKNLEKQK